MFPPSALLMVTNKSYNNIYGIQCCFDIYIILYIHTYNTNNTNNLHNISLHNHTN